MGAEYLSYVISIATFAPTFYGYIIFVLASVIDLSYVVTVKSTVEISQNFVALSEYMNFKLYKVPETILLQIAKILIM